MGAQIASPTRQAAIKRAMIGVFATGDTDGKQGKGAA
jgi:hypothetical protein